MKKLLFGAIFNVTTNLADRSLPKGEYHETFR